MGKFTGDKKTKNLIKYIYINLIRYDIIPPFNFESFFRGVMVAQKLLVLLVRVRILTEELIFFNAVDFHLLLNSIAEFIDFKLTLSNFDTPSVV